MQIYNIVLAALYSTAIASGGLIVGLLFALVFYTLSISQRLRPFTNTVALALKCTPAFIFPFLVGSYMGIGDSIKILVSALICFFTIYAALSESEKRVPVSLRLLAASLGASTYQTWRRVKLPWLTIGALEGLKAAAPLAVVGAIVAEFVSPSQSEKFGLGLLFSNNRNAIDDLLILILVATFLGLMLFVSMNLLLKTIESRLRIGWK